MIHQLDPFDKTFRAHLEKFSFRSNKRHSGVSTGGRRSRRSGSSLEFTDYRTYSYGDDPRTLDWSLYARTDKLFVRVFEEEDDLSVHLLVDCSASMAALPGVTTGSEAVKLRFAFRLATALSYVALTSLDRLQLHLFSSGLIGSSQSCRSRSAFSYVLQYLAIEQLSRERTSLSNAANQFLARTRGSGLCVVISDFLDPDWKTGLNALRRRGFEVILLSLISESDECQTLSGDCLLTDIEDSEAVEVILNKTSRKAFQNELEQFRAEIRDFCGKRGIAYLEIRVDDDLTSLTLSKLKAAGVLF